MSTDEPPPNAEVERLRAKQREYDRKRWADPEKRARMLAAERVRRATPEYAAKRRAYQKTPAQWEAFLERQRRRRAANGRPSEDPVKKAERRDRNKAMRRGARVERVYRTKVWVRDGGVCHICRVPVDRAAWDLDHVIPVSRGGVHCYSNVRVSHPYCNRKKHDHDPRDSGSPYAYLLEVS